MLPLERLAESTLPDGVKLELSGRGDDLYLHADRQLILESTTQRFDETIASVACDSCALRKVPRVLLDGLGLGLTLRALLAASPPHAKVMVIEPARALVDWNRKLMGEEAAAAMSDPRVSVFTKPLSKVLRPMSNDPGFDVMLLNLDEDSGSAASWLRSPKAVDAARRALREHGTLIYTSPRPEREFANSLRSCGMNAEGFTVFLNPDRKKGRRLNFLTAQERSSET